MPFDALSALRNLKSPANVSGALDPFAPPDHALSAGEMGSLDAIRGQATEALGAGPAFHALSQALDRNRFANTSEDLAERDSLASGVPHDIAMQHAAITNDVGDVTSERGAERQFMPFASQLHERNMGDVLQRNEAQYGYPAMVKARADLEGAQIAGNARVAAAGARDASLPMRGLMDALSAFVNKNGKMPTPDEVAAMRATFGVK